MLVALVIAPWLSHLNVSIVTAMPCMVLRPGFTAKLWFIINQLLPRLIMIAIFLQTEKMSPFNRYIHPDEMWLYRNPRRESYVSNITLWSLVLITPLTLSLLYFIFRRDKDDFLQIILAVTLSLGLNCIITNMVKLIVGRPRPDFFWRCFPDGEMNSEMQCTGKYEDVIEGRKSFPSGHSSISFSSLGTMSWWLMGKLHVWSTSRGSPWRLIISLLPIVAALTVALSRTCDYHHHWQDVLIGSALGIITSYMCYRQHYPPLNSSQCHKPYISNRQTVSTIARKETPYSSIQYNSDMCLSCKFSQSSENIQTSSENLGDISMEEKDLEINVKSDNVYEDLHKSPYKNQMKWI